MTDVNLSAAGAELADFFVLGCVRASHAVPGIEQQVRETADAAAPHPDQIYRRTRRGVQQGIHLLQAQGAHDSGFKIPDFPCATSAGSSRSPFGGSGLCAFITHRGFGLEFFFRIASAMSRAARLCYRCAARLPVPR